MFEINQLNCCHYLSLQAHKLYESDVYHFSVITRQRDEVHSQPSMLAFLITNRITGMEAEDRAFLSGLFYKNSIHVAVDAVVIQLECGAGFPLRLYQHPCQQMEGIY